MLMLCYEYMNKSECPSCSNSDFCALKVLFDG